MRLQTIKNKKGIELSINVIVIVALAVFVLFIVTAFVLGGFTKLTELIWGPTKVDPQSLARINCQNDYLGWKNEQSPLIVKDDKWDKALCQQRTDVSELANGYVCSEYNIKANCPS